MDRKTDAIKGKCTSMCPTDEYRLRVKNKIVHELEKKIDE